MGFDTFLQALRAFTRRRPFVPFLVQFGTGETLTISHPEAVRPVGQLFMLTEPSSRRRLFDSDSVSQLLEILPEEA